MTLVGDTREIFVPNRQVQPVPARVLVGFEPTNDNRLSDAYVNRHLASPEYEIMPVNAKYCEAEETLLADHVLPDACPPPLTPRSPSLSFDFCISCHHSWSNGYYMFIAINISINKLE